MKIVIFGAAGGTGSQLVEQAICAGHTVTAIVRNPDAWGIRHQDLEIIRGDVLHPDTYVNAMKGKDLVISCLGTATRKPTTLYSEGMKNITAVMQKAGLKRIICLSAGAVIVPPLGSFMMKFLVRNVLQKLLKHPYADMLIMEKELRNADLDWTVIRPPWLRDTPRTGQYRMAIGRPLANPSKISRADLADCILHLLDNKETFKCIVELSY